MNTACRWAISCPAANCAELGCECAAFMVSDEMKLDNATEIITPQYVCMDCAASVSTMEASDCTTHRGSCDCCGEFELLYSARAFGIVQMQRRVAVRKKAIER